MQSIYLSNVLLAKNRGIYITSKELDGEPELRNKLTAIWISGLLDLVGSFDTLVLLEDEAAIREFRRMIQICERTKNPIPFS